MRPISRLTRIAGAAMLLVALLPGGAAAVQDPDSCGSNRATTFTAPAPAGLLTLGGLASAQFMPSPVDLNRVSAGKPAPDFELPSAAGGAFKLSSLRGKNVVLVFYRGYW